MIPDSHCGERAVPDTSLALGLWRVGGVRWSVIAGGSHSRGEHHQRPLQSLKELLLNLTFILLPMLSYDVGRDLKTEFLQLWGMMAMVVATVLMGRRSG